MVSPETRYIQKIHRQTKKIPDIWTIRMQMGMGAPKGIPDVLYRGLKSDLWVEYKYVPDITKIRKIPISKMSPFQKEWFTKTTEIRTQNVALVVGDEQGNGVFIYAELMDKRIDLNTIAILTPKEMATFIHSQVCYS